MAAAELSIASRKRQRMRKFHFQLLTLSTSWTTTCDTVRYKDNDNSDDNNECCTNNATRGQSQKAETAKTTNLMLPCSIVLLPYE